MMLNKSEIRILSDLAFKVLLRDTMKERKMEYERISNNYIDKISLEKRELATSVIQEFLYEDDVLCNNGCKVDLIGGWLSFEDIKNKNEAKEKAVYRLQNGAFGRNRTLEEATKMIQDVKPYSNSFTMEDKLKEISLKYGYVSFLCDNKTKPKGALTI